MISYQNGKWHLAHIFRIKGSVFPKAFMWATPAAICSFDLRLFVFTDDRSNDVHNMSNVVTTVASSFTYVLGFLLVFRSQQAYSRYWEGVSLVQQTRGQWFNATSSLIAFCSTDTEKRDKVDKFQHLIVRLISILHCTALQQIAEMDDSKFATIDRSGIDVASMSYLAAHTEKCEIIFLWIQRLIMENISNGVLCAAPPIISRIFQDLSLGIVNVNNARKINEVPFPFPYAQMVTVMLLIFTMITPVSLSLYADDAAIAGLITFISVSIYWCINYIAAELEMPFGCDDNDLPLGEFQARMNTSLKTLLEEHAQIPPTFELPPNHTAVVTEAVLSWKSGLIAAPRPSAQANSSEAVQWAEVLKSRRRSPTEDALDPISQSSEHSCASTATAANPYVPQAAPGVLQMLHCRAPTTKVHGSHSQDPCPTDRPENQAVSVSQLQHMQLRSDCQLDASLHLYSKKIADYLEGIAQEVKFLAQVGKQLPGFAQLSQRKTQLPKHMDVAEEEKLMVPL